MAKSTKPDPVKAISVITNVLQAWSHAAKTATINDLQAAVTAMTTERERLLGVARDAASRVSELERENRRLQARVVALERAAAKSPATTA